MSISVTKKCYALMWSYGEICVHCNCCGRFGRKGMWKARLDCCKQEVKRLKTFNNWREGFEELQRKNIAKDLKYFHREIKKIKSHLTK